MLINKIYRRNLIPNNVVDNIVDIVVVMTAAAVVVVDDWFIFKDNVVVLDDDEEVVVSLLSVINTAVTTAPITIALTKLPNPHANHFANLLFKYIKRAVSY